MKSHNDCHVVFGKGPVGMSIMEELRTKAHRIRIINHGGKADSPEGAELLKGDV